ncbi:MAG: type I DNA topoisomerase [bacterium]
MSQSLVIVESPTKARTIGNMLGDAYIVKSSMGHIRDLPDYKMGVDVKKDFTPTYEVSKGSKKVVKELKDAVKKASQVYIATDEDREGEAIGWHITIATKAEGKHVKRVVFHEITKEAVNRAFQKPRDIDLRLVNAQQARRILDRLVGYKLSPLLGKKIRFGLSAGRVQSVALRLIVEREREIEKFKPEEYWTVKAKLSKHQSEVIFDAQLMEKEGKKYDKLDIENEKDAKAIVSDLDKEEFKVLKITRREKRKNPSGPFNTSSLQQEAVRKLSFSPKKTMMLAQQLYEGVDIGAKGVTGLITYMRTDSLHVADSARAEALAFVKQEYGQKFLPKKPRSYKTKTKAAQEAHEAIRPTSVRNTPQEMKAFLTHDQLKLYTLVWQRFLASQMASAVFNTVSVDIQAGKYMFRSTGQVVKFSGFMEVYMESSDNDKDDAKQSVQMLPELSLEEVLILRDLLPEQHFTEPPPRFNEASLVKVLEKNGIGRPSTYAPILSTIVNRGYVYLESRKFYPQKIGIIVNDMLVKNFSEIVDVNFTAQMEEELDEIAFGKRNWVDVLNKFYVPFAKDLELAQSKMKYEEVCEKCGKPMVIKRGPFGQFLACTGYPQCTNTVSLSSRAKGGVKQVTNQVCEKCGKPMVVRRSRKGPFLACSGFPACKNTKPLRKKAG